MIHFQAHQHLPETTHLLRTKPFYPPNQPVVLDIKDEAEQSATHTLSWRTWRSEQRKSSVASYSNSHCTAFQFPITTFWYLVLRSIHKSNLLGLLVGADDTYRHGLALNSHMTSGGIPSYAT
jgi:hypothetical protein